MDLKRLRDTPPWDWPENAGTKLLRVLRDGTARLSDRLLAAELAGDVTVNDDEIASALLAIVRSGDEPAELRGRAAIALGPSLEQAEMEEFDVDEAGDRTLTEGCFNTIQESLRAVFMDGAAPQEVRRRALEASVRASQDWHADAVRTAYGNDDPAWKLTSVFCMGYVPGFDDEIVEALASDDAEILYAAVCAAGNRSVTAAWPHLSAIVQRNETDKPLLLAAIEALPSIRPRETLALLGELLDSEDEDVAAAAEEAFALAQQLLDGDDDVGQDDLFGDDELELDDGTAVSRKGNVVRLKTRLDFGPRGVPLDQLDKIREAAKPATVPSKASRKVGRNERCPCGSGKKYKNCCGR